MNFHALFVYVLELPLPLGPRAPDPEAEPLVKRHPEACNIFLIGNYPMPCGEGQAFHSTKLACVDEAEADC